MEDVDELRIARVVRLRAHVAVHLVPARVLHRVGLGKLSGILPLADRRMIPRDLVDAAAPQLVEPRIADVTDHEPVVGHDRDREDARHPLPLGPQRGQPVDLVVGDRDRLAHAVVDLARLALEARAQHRERGLGRFLAGGLTAHAVDDDEQAPGRIVVEAILVDRTLQPRMAVPRRPQGDADLHEGIMRDR